MSKTVLIILAAVVALIVIVVLTGLRYLRADDEDDFDDDIAAEHGRSRAQGSRAGSEQARSRRHPDDDPRDRRPREPRAPVPAGAGIRSTGRGTDPGRGMGPGQDGRAGSGRGPADSLGAGRPGRPGPASGTLPRGRGADRGRRGDGAWPEDSDRWRNGDPSEDAGARGGRSAVRGSRTDRPAARRDHDDIGEPMQASRDAGVEPGRSGRRGSRDFDSLPGRSGSRDAGAASRGYPGARDGADRDRADRDRADRDRAERDWAGRDEDRTERYDRRDDLAARDRREPRPGHPVREIADIRAAADGGRDGAAGREDRDRRSTSRPHSRPDARKNGAAEDREDLLPAVKPRQGRSKRNADGDWPSNEWDELSDVDYWAELASDKPLTTHLPADSAARQKPAAPERADRARGESRTDSGAGQRGDREAGRAARQSREPRRSGEGTVPAAAALRGPAPAGGSQDLGRNGSRDAGRGHTDQLTAASASASSGGPLPGWPGAGGPDASLPGTGKPNAGQDWAARRQVPADDDPLTSPSFPRITADDSRSYRRSRSSSADTEAGRGPDDGHDRGRQPRHGHSGEHRYPVTPPVEPIRGIDGPGRSRSLPQTAANGAGYGADYASSQEYSRPPADPYRSVPASDSLPGSYQTPAVASYSPAESAPSGYRDGYPAHGVAEPGRYDSAARPAAGFVPSVAGSGDYGADSVTHSYRVPGADPGYRDTGYGDTAYGDTGYGDTGYGDTAYGNTAYRDAGRHDAGYQPAGADPLGYPSAPSASAGYEQGTAGGGYSVPVGYGQDQAGLPGGYPDYAALSAASGAQLRPDPGYLPGYPAASEPALQGSSAAAHAEQGYPLYPAPVPASHASPYPPASAPYGAAGYPDQAAHSPYDPAGYPAPAPQPGYAGADPYAVDPYGHAGYGGGAH